MPARYSRLATGPGFAHDGVRPWRLQYWPRWPIPRVLATWA